MAAAEMTYSEAIRTAMAFEMERDSSVFLMGEDIGCYGGAFGVTRGLLERFGPERVRDLPISENGFVGLALGAAVMGMRPVVEIMFMDFIALAIDQIANQAAKMKAIYGLAAPLVVRTPAGGGRGYGPVHSQSLEAWFLSVPGLKVVAPATVADAGGLLLEAIRDDGPVLFLENKLLYGIRGPAPEPGLALPFGQAAVRRPGEDLTLITYSRMVAEALRAAEELAAEGIDTEVIDLRTLVPLDMDTVAASVCRTGRVLLVEEGCRRGGVMAEVGFRLFEHAYEYLDAPLKRLAMPEVPVPAGRSLEDALLPGTAAMVAAAREVMAQ